MDDWLPIDCVCRDNCSIDVSCDWCPHILLALVLFGFICTQLRVLAPPETNRLFALYLALQRAGRVVYRWISFRWRAFRHFCRRRPPQIADAPIWRLPPELFQLMAETMSPSTAAAFALTSQTTLHLLGHRALNLHGEELINLLEHFQPDMPHHLLCYQCCTFHLKLNLRNLQHENCALSNGYVSTATQRVLFTDAQAVMNYHLHGKLHSIPRQTAFHYARESNRGFAIVEDSELAISENEVILNQRIGVTFDRAKKKLPATSPRNVPFYLCPHLRCGQIFETPLDGMTFLKCPVCATEIKTYHSLFGDRCNELEITIWRLLGPCRSPLESQWRRVTEHSSRTRAALAITDASAAARPRFRDTSEVKVQGDSLLSRLCPFQGGG